MLEAVGDHVIPVVIGAPCMGELRLWSDSREYRYYFDDDAIVGLLWWGRVSRLRLTDGSEREMGFFDPGRLRLTLKPREPGTMLAEDREFSGHVFTLTDRPDPRSSGLHELGAVLSSGLFHIAMTGETMIVEPGGWDSIADPSPRPRVTCAVHRRSGWDEHIRLIAEPDPGASDPTAWPAVDDPDRNEIAFALHGEGIDRAVDLIVDAASRWGVDPPGLVLTFGAPSGRGEP